MKIRIITNADAPVKVRLKIRDTVENPKGVTIKVWDPWDPEKKDQEPEKEVTII